MLFWAQYNLQIWTISAATSTSSTSTVVPATPLVSSRQSSTSATSPKRLSLTSPKFTLSSLDSHSYALLACTPMLHLSWAASSCTWFQSFSPSTCSSKWATAATPRTKEWFVWRHSRFNLGSSSDPPCITWSKSTQSWLYRLSHIQVRPSHRSHWYL